MGPRERAIVYAAIIGAVATVLAAFVYVTIPKLFPLSATNSTTISVGGQSQTPASSTQPAVTVVPTQRPSCNGADTCGQGTSVANVTTCENGVQHQSGTNGTETVTGD